MKNRTEKTVITIETFQRTTIRSRKAARFVRCERCAAQAPSEDAAHQQIVRQILWLSGAGEIDSSETDNEKEERIRSNQSRAQNKE
ncbi:MAG: hypothetical protein ABIU09_11160 [Pyrinomonadaceae bacterium]